MALFSLAVLYLVVTIGWIAYHNYQPQLLIRYDLNSLKPTIFGIQGIVLIITPILAGFLGDWQRNRGLGRMPIITAGITFAALIFMSVAFSLFILPDNWVQLGLPVLIILWVFAMSLFTSPAISTIEIFSRKIELTTSMAIITLVFGLVSALEPIIVSLIDMIGPVLTFAGGGVFVLIAGYWFRKNIKKLPDLGSHEKTGAIHKNNFLTPLLLGIGLGIITTFIFNRVPDWVEVKKLPLHGNVVASVTLGLSAVFALPVGLRFSKILRGMMIYYLVALIMAALAIIGIQMSFSTLAISFLVIVLSASYALLFVLGLPLSTRFISDRHRVLGVGIFFAGMEVPNSIVEYFLLN